MVAIISCWWRWSGKSGDISAPKVLKAWKSTSGRSEWLATMPEVSPLFTGWTGVAYSIGESLRWASIAFLARGSSSIRTVWIQVIYRSSSQKDGRWPTKRKREARTRASGWHCVDRRAGQAPPLRRKRLDLGVVRTSVFAARRGRLWSCVGPGWLRLAFYLGARCKGDAYVFVDGLAFVVVFGMRLAVGAGDGLGGFVRFEAQIAGFVFVSFGVIAEAVVAEHQVVVGLEIFWIDRERLLEFLDSIGVVFFEKQYAAEFVAHDAVAGELC